MKRSKSGLLLAGLLIIMLCGCESRGFKAEREMYRAQKRAQQIYKNPKGTPPFELQQAVEAYKVIIERYPDSLFAIQAKFNIGHLYLAVGDYERARAEYGKLTTNCTRQGNLCAEAFSAIGKSYEAEQKWPEALTQYKHVMEAFPESGKGLRLPLYIIHHYRPVTEAEFLRRSVDEGVAFYMNLKAKAKTERGRFVMQSLISRCYIEGGQWQDALDVLDKLIRDYPDFNPEEAIFVKALIYNNSLKDKLKAKQELQKIVTDYPRSKLAKQAEKILKKL